MNSNSSNDDQNRDLEDVIEHDPQSKRGAEGKKANEGQQAGANSDRAGQPVAPQIGDPRAKDRRPN